MNKIHKLITNYLLEKIREDEILPWVCCWSKYSDAPQNFETKKTYRGINSMVLSFGKSPYWLTMKQIKNAGGYVKKGAKSAPCVYYDFYPSKDKKDKEGNPLKFPFLRYYRIFNVSDCGNIDLPKNDLILKNNDKIKKCEEIISNYKDSPLIENRGFSQKAYYSVANDVVVVPKIEQFNNSESYYSALFHELAHSTGHSSRLNRNLDGFFGSDCYSKEELIAEITSCFLCREAGIDNNINNSASYLKSWLSVLSNNEDWIIWGAQQAQKAQDYILGVNFE